MTPLLSVALTGNVASGKSSVADIWRAEGVPVISSDDLARDVVEPGSEGLREVVAIFGDEVVKPDGTLDRAALRKRVFADEPARRRLESILHPRIWIRRTAWTRERAREGHALVVAEVPLLFEAGLEGQFDATVLVDAPAPVRLARLLDQRGLEREDATAIMEAQLDARIKRAKADYVLDNAGSPEDLEREALELLTRLRQCAASPPSPS